MRSMRAKFCLLIRLLTCVGLGVAFTTDPISHALFSADFTDATHASITVAGIKRAVRQYFLENNPNPPPSSPSPKAIVQSWSLLDLVGVKTDSDLVDIFRIRHGIECALNLVSYQAAVQEIVIGNANTDNDPALKDRADFHFDAEQFNDSNANVIAMLEKARAALAENKLSDARTAFGHALHPSQDFYSHSNWVEMGNDKPNLGLGNKDGFGLPVAEPDVNTCVPCPQAIGECKDNIVVRDKLTSGYYRGTVEETGADGKPLPKLKGKCSHGGWLDQSAKEDPLGGINKDTSDPSSSPHGYLHRQAADLAEETTANIVTAFRRQIGNDEFEKFLALGQPQCQNHFRHLRSAEAESKPRQKVTLLTKMDQVSNDDYLLPERFSSQQAVLITSTTASSGKTVTIPVDSTVEEFVINVYGSAKDANLTILVTSPTNVIHTFKPAVQSSPAVIHVQAPEPGLWRLDVSGPEAPYQITALGISSWNVIVNVMTMVEQRRHVKGPGLKPLQPGEPLKPGSKLYVYIIAPVDNARIRQLELQALDGSLVGHVSVTDRLTVQDGFERQLLEVVIPRKQFRLVVRGKDENDFDVIRVSETVYSPKGAVVGDRGSSDKPTSDSGWVSAILPSDRTSSANVATLTCIIVFLWLLAILVVILLKVGTDRCRGRKTRLKCDSEP